MTGRKAVERKRFGNHYEAYEFEYQARNSQDLWIGVSRDLLITS